MEHEILTPHLIELIVGGTAVVGGILIVAGLVIAKAFGFIHFGKEGEALKTCPAHLDLLKGQKQLSDNHKSLAGQVKDISDNQIRNMEKHEEHQKAFANGAKMMKKLSCDIKNLSIGIAVLLDRQPDRKQKIPGVELDLTSLIKALTTKEDNDV